MSRRGPAPGPPQAAATHLTEAPTAACGQRGRVLTLFRSGDVKRSSRALACGSASNQNAQCRPKIAVRLIAQERVIRAACAGVGVQPWQLPAVDCHGTGTELRDPVEVSALARTVGSGRSDCRQPTAAKAIFGHMGPSAGCLCLVVTVLLCRQLRTAPEAMAGSALRFGPPTYIRRRNMPAQASAALVSRPIMLSSSSGPFATYAACWSMRLFWLASRVLLVPLCVSPRRRLGTLCF